MFICDTFLCSWKYVERDENLIFREIKQDKFEDQRYFNTNIRRIFIWSIINNYICYNYLLVYKLFVNLFHPLTFQFVIICIWKFILTAFNAYFEVCIFTICIYYSMYVTSKCVIVIMKCYVLTEVLQSRIRLKMLSILLLFTIVYDKAERCFGYSNFQFYIYNAVILKWIIHLLKYFAFYVYIYINDAKKLS